VAANDSEETLVLAILLVWVAGLVLAGARACIARCLFILFRSRRRLVTDEALLLRVSELARGLRFSRRVRLIESGRLASPIAFGLLRPTIGLPRDFVARFDPEKRDVMLAHELAHLASHDPFWCLLADAASALLWWHPCVWWMRRQLHLASELAADEASLLVVDGPRVLAECLVELGGQLAGPRLVAPLGISGFRSNLGCRVQRLIHLEGRNWSPPRTAYSLLVRCLGAPALVAMGLLCTAWIAPNDLMKGDGMNTIRQNWKRSLAMLALLGTVNAQTAEPAGGPAAPTAKASDPTAPIASSGQHRTVRIFPLGHALAAEVKGKVQSKLSESDTVLADDRSNAIVVVVENDELEKIAELIQQLDAAESAPAASPENALRRRYALVGVEQDWRGPAREPAGTENQPSPLEKKLREIVLSEVSFDGLPLGEVLRYLNDQALKQDKNKTGINFLVSQNGNSAPPQPGMIDPATGLPVASGSEAFDVSQVAIKFSLPLKHVTLKNVLDAIVKVADEPIEYTVEDYAVVFSPRAGPVSGWRRKAAAYGAPAGQAQFPGAAAGPVLLSIDPATGLSGSTEGVPVRGPGGFNIDFGVWRPEPSKQVGPAAAGKPGDFWNTVGVPNADHHTESGMRFASGEPSAIQVEMFNLGGGWGNSGLMGVKDPMLDTFNYPVNNQGGNSQVILHQVPPGKYDVYIYGHGAKSAGYYGDYTLSVGSHKYGRKTTTHGMDAERNTKWVEGSQYVKFSGVKVGPDEKVEILIQPGAQVSDESGRTFADAMICGLQLIPKN
jgi:beta-lactamase regulating signal transducer with metallopeptidase domain